jgi:hypothetical protein
MFLVVYTDNHSNVLNRVYEFKEGLCQEIFHLPRGHEVLVTVVGCELVLLLRWVGVKGWLGVLLLSGRCGPRIFLSLCVLGCRGLWLSMIPELCIN